MKKSLLFLTMAMTIFASCEKEKNEEVKTEIKNAFSVSATKQVYFSQGNLQYQASTGSWRFAKNQYDIVRSDNANISSSYTGWIDLFGWGTSGYGSKYPYMTSTNYSDYGNGETDIAGTLYDWGVYIGSSITNGASSQWRTLTNAEWAYLLWSRTNAAGKYGKATVASIAGMVLLPDSWTLPSGCSFTSGNGSGFTINTYTVEQWSAMEANGAVFLPAAGHRYYTRVNDVGALGYYWSSSYYNSDIAYSLYFTSRGVDPSCYDYRRNGFSVRLAQDL